MNWPWSKKGRDYAYGATEVRNDFVKRVFAETTGELHKLRPTRDLHYLALEEGELKAFAWKYHNPGFVYHSNSDEFPDCDDFALMARGSFAYGAVDSKLKYSVLFGGVSYYSRRLQGWHRANWAITSAGRLLIFEPQTGQWYAWADEVQEFREANI